MAPRPINVRRDNPDEYYRYKMEPLQTKIEGKGNGIKTVIVNLTSVARSLERPRKWVLKYFGFELGAQTKDDEKNDRWIVNGAHESAKLQDLLDGFINKFVLCPDSSGCKNPETRFQLEDGGKGFKFVCKACGRENTAKTSHKFYGYVLKELNDKRKKQEIEDKAAAKAAKRAKQNGTADDAADENGENGSDDAKDDSNGHDTPAEDAGGDDPELAKLRAEVARVTVAAAEPNDVWATDTTEKGVKARAEQIAGVTDFDKLGFWIQDQNEALGGPDKVDEESIVKKIEELNIEGEFKTIQVLAQTLFDENIVAQIPKRADFLQKMVDEDEELEMAIIVGTERLLGALRKVDKKICETSGKILQLYYQHDVVSEEVIWKWANEGPNESSKTSRKVHDGAQKFLELLKEAESEEDSDEDSE